MLIKGDIAVTKRELCDQDWKTQLSKRYPNIPKGEEVTFLRKCGILSRYYEANFN